MQTSCTVKIIDGLYLGDQTTARDEEFLLLNHVGLVVNMTANQIPNYYQHYDIKYQNAAWLQQNEEGEWEDLCFEIQEVRTEGQCVLLHGLDHIEGPACLASLYLMNKFRWSLYKTLEYMQVRIDNLIFEPHSFEILKKVEMNLLGEKSKLSYNWDQRPSDYEELVLRNTFLNCREGQQKQKNPTQLKSHHRSVAKLKKQQTKITNKRRVTWETLQDQNSSKKIALDQKKVRCFDSEPKDQLKNRIIMSVRKILNNNSTKRKELNERTAMKSQKSLATSVNSQQSNTLKKYKSSYELISLKSVEYPIKNQTQLSSRDKQRLLTQRTHSIEREEEGPNTKLKTQGGELNGKVVIEVHIPTNKNCFKTCKSLTVNREKQNIVPPKLKIPLRRPASTRK